MATLDQDDLDAIKALFTAGDMVMALKRFVVVNNTSDAAFSITNSAGNAVDLHATGGNAIYAASDDFDSVFLYTSAPNRAGLVTRGDGDGGAGWFSRTSGTGSAPIRLINEGDGPGAEIFSSGAGNHDVALLGSGDILGGSVADPEADRGSTGGDLTTTLMIERIYRRLFRPASRSKAAGKMVLKDNAGDTVASMNITDDGAGEETQGAMS